MEDSSFQMSLGDLKTAIKEFKKNTPKLTSKKSDLLAFAAKVGLGKKKVEEVKGLEVEKKISKKLEKVVKVPEALPEVLKKVEKPSKKSEKVEKSVEAPKKKGSPFSAFMAANKGKGYSMREMSEMYKSQKV
tara:strand:- start:217 stop:612 length:396 start_codon:yes stop_codon:yes gene_type:complete